MKNGKIMMSVWRNICRQACIPVVCCSRTLKTRMFPTNHFSISIPCFQSTTLLFQKGLFPFLFICVAHTEFGLVGISVISGESILKKCLSSSLHICIIMRFLFETETEKRSLAFRQIYWVSLGVKLSG